MHDLGSKINVRITAKSGETNLISSEFAEYRWFPEDLFSEQSFYSYYDRLTFLSFKDKEAEITTIRQSEFAEGYRNLFKIAWDHFAKTPIKT